MNRYGYYRGEPIGSHQELLEVLDSMDTASLLRSAGFLFPATSSRRCSWCGNSLGEHQRKCLDCGGPQ